MLPVYHTGLYGRAVPDILAQLSFAAVVADYRFPAAIACALLAGIVRGFSGFGSALVFIPIMSALYGPQLAAGTFVLIDLAVDAMLLPGIFRKTRWREVWPMAAAAVVAGQFGAVILQYADPQALRWAISAIVLGVVAILASGWRYPGRPVLIVSLAVGALSGLLGSSMQIAGPPVILYWLGSAADAATVRANFIGFFTLLSLGLFWTYAARDLITPEAVALALLTGPVQVFSTWIGTRLFHVASAATYRKVAYLVVAMVAFATLPLLDNLWRG